MLSSYVRRFHYVVILALFLSLVAATPAPTGDSPRIANDSSPPCLSSAFAQDPVDIECTVEGTIDINPLVFCFTSIVCELDNVTIVINLEEPECIELDVGQ